MRKVLPKANTPLRSDSKNNMIYLLLILLIAAVLLNSEDGKVILSYCLYGGLIILGVLAFISLLVAVLTIVYLIYQSNPDASAAIIAIFVFGFTYRWIKSLLQKKK